MQDQHSVAKSVPFVHPLSDVQQQQQQNVLICMMKATTGLLTLIIMENKVSSLCLIGEKK